MHPRAAELVAALDLSPHPEGGFYRETYRAASRVATAGGERAASTAIYALFVAGGCSCWHRTVADEIWHFYEGEPLELLVLDPAESAARRHLLGTVGATSRPQVVVAGGCWQAARPLGAYTLVGCTVAPGFEFADFEMARDLPAEAAFLRAAAPDLAELI